MMSHETDVMKTMLIVDDEPAVRELLSAILQECGYSCLAVEDVPAARQALIGRSSPPLFCSTRPEPARPLIVPPTR